MGLLRLMCCLLLHLIVLAQISQAVQLPYSSQQASRSGAKIEGEWGTWSAWSTCSVECATGVSSRKRRCERSFTKPYASLIAQADASVECKGGGREIRICNRQPCPPNVENVRESLCRKFNARVFNGKKYDWEPYINPNNKCELTCRAKGQHFYARLANRVGDGTPCGIDAPAVCIRRKCIEVGCDDLVGSEATRDICGVCKGDNSTCRTMSGVFTRLNLPHGYTKIITIPRGSTRINITELKPSTNYLSIQTGGQSIINGDWSISTSGNYYAAGTTFVYKKQSTENPGERLYAVGPINQTVDLMMLVYHGNPGVEYTFNVPVNVTDAYFRDLISQNENHHYAYTTPTASTPSTTSVRNIIDLTSTKNSDIELGSFSEKTMDKNGKSDFVEEGVLKRPNMPDNAEEGGTFGEKDYTFHETTGATVVLKANADSWPNPSGGGETQSQEGPKFVMAELRSRKSKSSEGPALEVVEGDGTVVEEGAEERTEKKIQQEEAETELGWDKYSSEKMEHSEDSDINVEERIDETDRFDREEEGDTGEGTVLEESSEPFEEEDVTQEDVWQKETTMAPVIEYDTTVTNIEEEVVLEETDVDEKKVFDSIEITTRGQDRIVFDDGRGEEVLGFGDRYQESQERPVKQARGFTVPKQAGILEDGAPRNSVSNSEELGEYLPMKIPSTTEQPRTTPITQRDSSFKTYSRSLGQAEVKPAIRRVGRLLRGPAQRVRTPKYSQSFTFRDRYKAILDAQRRRLTRHRQRHLHRLGQARSGTAAVSQRIGTRTRHQSNTQIQPTDQYEPESKISQIQARVTSRQNQPTTQATSQRGRQRQQRLNVPQTPDDTSVTLRANLASKGGNGDERLRQERLSVSERQRYVNRQPDRERNKGASSQQQSRRQPGQTVDNRRIVDETLPLGHFDRAIDPRESQKRIVLPEPVRNIPTGPQVIQHRPVINSRPRYESRPSTGRSNIVNTVDPVTGLYDPYRNKKEALTAGASYSRNGGSQNGRSPSSGNTRKRLNEIPGSSYVWRVSGFSECTITCGGGVQQTVVVCVYTRNQAVVTDENCRRLEKPTPKAVTCNTRPCPAKWELSDWTSCTASCGQGTQTRSAICKARVSATLNLTMPEESCEEEKPSTQQSCNIKPCYSWVTGNWSKCSSKCGTGSKTREVTCTDASDTVITSQLCTDPKPATEEECDMGSCGKGWYFTAWPEECPAMCGEGKKQRKILCADEGGSPLDADRCDSADKPSVEMTCRADTPCGGNWFAADWSKCNATCGYAVKTRDVACVKKLPGELLTVVTEDNCKGKEKPETIEECGLDECPSIWYMTSWSQCSKTCGTGLRTREIKCLDPFQQPSADCPVKRKPRSREPCNTQSCTTSGGRKKATDSSCKDSFSLCKMVRKARLCRYKYYARMCCLSCSQT